MRVVLQRVISAEARQGETVVAAIDGGLVAYVGFARGDDEAFRDLLPVIKGEAPAPTR